MRFRYFVFIQFAMLSILNLALVNNSIAADVPSSTSSWVWPIDETFIVLNNAKFNTTLENTGYSVKNLDLVHPATDHLTCFDVGWHRTYHAGVDLYRKDGNTEGTFVRAVSNGTVEYVDSGTDNLSVIIEHPNDGVWSVYWHLEDLQVDVNDNVTTGQIIGKVYHQDYFGRFPEIHTFGADDSHLHFEIRSFYDGGAIFPSGSECNGTYVPGPGYTYPLPPDAFGYLDPIEYLETRVPTPSITSQTHLPIIHNEPTPCIEGQDLVTSNRNSGFEYPVTNPLPWFEVTTYFDPPDTQYYNFIQNNSAQAHSGNHYAFLGNQRPQIGWIVDEEMPQSFRVPNNIEKLTWVQHLWLEGSPTGDGTEPGDQFTIILKDAETGRPLSGGILIDSNSDLPNFVWIKLTYTLNNASLSNKLVSISYSSLTDGDVAPSTMRVDDVSVITSCGTGAAGEETQAETFTIETLGEPLE